MSELETRLETLVSHVRATWAQIAIPDKRAELAALKEKSMAPELWNDPNSARVLMQRLSELQEEVDYWSKLRQEVEGTQELLLIADEDLLPELEAEVTVLERELDRAEFRLMLSGEYDRGSAIFAIHAGAGGTDAQDWTEMLFRMYLRWAEQSGFNVELLDSMPGDEAGLKSATVAMSGKYAYGYLRAERGVHRLVRLSPFDSAHRRHTSFALVEAWPDLGAEVQVDIKPDDLEIDTFRASSAGGQHMQKNETAVRIHHLPSGIVVQCQNERSQTQNRETAMRIIKARLIQQEEDKRRAKIDTLKGERTDMGWGNQIRSYVLHPYRMVKDHRTGYETGNVDGVLDGDLAEFIAAYLRLGMGDGESN
ncbi:MAG: peptide chain release factor 2 [Chloroflexota bacterium]|nr:peptide chain release factor 2 [Chloroflexota bacterium]